MSDRAKIFGDIRRALGVTGNEDARRRAVAARLAAAPGASSRRAAAPPILLPCFVPRPSECSRPSNVAKADEIPARIADFLRAKNLPPRLRKGDDAYLAALPWTATTLTIEDGPAQADDRVGLSHAFAGIAETGTLALVSGPNNPATLNFCRRRISSSSKRRRSSAITRLAGKCACRLRRGRDAAHSELRHRAVASAGIQQTLLLGAHGPRAPHTTTAG